jgi:UDP-N-acetylmuramyl tripeptide synthase
MTSTDFIRVGDRITHRGDYSGTGGARMLLRQPEVEIAVLEVARGGLLRRGLGVEHADVAVITNVASDHLGEYGINSVPELIQAKFIVRRALDKSAPLVLNADDAGLVEHASALDQQISWFSLDPDNLQVRNALARGETAGWLEDGWLMAARGGQHRRLVPINDIPATMNGVARHNIRNALAAMCVSLALGIDDNSIRKGLFAFRGDEHDNPGRGNWFERRVDGGVIRILVDFAHNEHGMQALAEAVRQVPAERIILLIGQAGDRSDQDINDLVRAACSIDPDQLLATELPGYERGRKPFEVPEMIRREAIRFGVPQGAVEIFPGPVEATASALGRALPGDLLVLLALSQRSEALSLVHEFLEKSRGSHG